MPTEHDLTLIEVAYEVLAARSFCTRCGAPLGRGLSLYPGSSDSGDTGWRLVVATRCRGWRRHAHTAVVTDDGTDLLIGPF